MRTNHLEQIRIDKLFDLTVQDAYRLENARLLEQADAIDETAEHSAESSARLDQSVMRLIRLEQKKHRRLHRVFVARRVAIIVLVILIVTSSALMSVEAIRESTIRTLVAWSDKVLNILFNPDPHEQQGTSETSAADDPASTREYRPAWLPDGFTLTNDVTDISGKWHMLVYLSADGRQSLTLTQSHLTGGGTLSIDTENALSQKVLVKGLNGILVTSAQPGEGENKLWWKDQGTSFLISANLDPDIMIRVAESLEIIPDT